MQVVSYILIIGFENKMLMYLDLFLIFQIAVVGFMIALFIAKTFFIVFYLLIKYCTIKVSADN